MLASTAPFPISWRIRGATIAGWLELNGGLLAFQRWYTCCGPRSRRGRIGIPRLHNLALGCSDKLL